MSTNPHNADKNSRRAFLKTALVGGGTLAAASVAAAPTHPVRPDAASVPARPTRGLGYRKTDAVRRYYQSAREI